MTGIGVDTLQRLPMRGVMRLRARRSPATSSSGPIRPQRQVDWNHHLTPVDDRVGAPSSVPTRIPDGTRRLSALNGYDL
jgi:hypothetical protein